MTDEEIVGRVLAGDTASFELLMRRNNVHIYRAVRAVLRDDAEAEDAMQAAYVHAYEKLASFRGAARFATWLTQIALNEAFGRLRSDRRHPHVSLTAVEEPTAMSASPETQAGRRELARLIEHAVDELPEIYRVVFVMREVDGMTTADVAAALAVSEDVVKTRLSRAKSALREGLEQQLGAAAPEAFAFHAPRCDRVVADVMSRLRQLPR